MRDNVLVRVVARELDSIGSEGIDRWGVHAIIMKADVAPPQIVRKEEYDMGRRRSFGRRRDTGNAKRTSSDRNAPSHHHAIVQLRGVRLH